MDIREAIRTRKSIRGYKPDPVSREILREILEVATRSPSGNNVQPWEITVVSGDVLNKMRQANLEMTLAGAPPSPELPFTAYEDKYKQRQVEIGIELFKLMGIAREDREKRAEWLKRGDRYFDAPAAIILSVDRSLKGHRALLDVGALLQTICLTALSYGLGTCIMGQGINHPEVVRKFTPINESKQILMCITIGYPDLNFPANKIESRREPLDNVVTWCGFD